MTSIEKMPSVSKTLPLPSEYIPPDIQRQEGTDIDILKKNIDEYTQKIRDSLENTNDSDNIDWCENFEAPDELPEHRKGYDDDPNAHIFGNRKWDQEHVDVDDDFWFNWSNEEEDDGWCDYRLEAGESRE